MNKTKTEKIAVYAGSFNPFTNGHLSVVKEASDLFDKVFICIAANSDKKPKLFQGMDNAITDTINNEGLENVVVVNLEETLVADFCKAVGAKYLVRALRNTTDYLYEENIAKINYEINSELSTIYLRAKPEFENISSSMVRELYNYGKDVSKYLPDPVAKLFGKDDN